jgi:hypothetical protein
LKPLFAVDDGRFNAQPDACAADWPAAPVKMNSPLGVSGIFALP